MIKWVTYLSSYVLFFLRNELNNYNNTGAQILDSIYHLVLNYFEITYLEWNREYFVIMHTTMLRTSLHNVPTKGLFH